MQKALGQAFGSEVYVGPYCTSTVLETWTNLPRGAWPGGRSHLARSSRESKVFFVHMARLLVLCALLPSAAAFMAPVSAVGSCGRTSAVSCGLFDGLSAAFANDDTLGARQNAGLSKEKEKRTVTWVGPKGNKKQAQAISGQKLRDVARGSGVPIVYDCNEGTCKTCEAMVDGRRTKICVGRMPNKDCTIKYNIR